MYSILYKEKESLQQIKYSLKGLKYKELILLKSELNEKQRLYSILVKLLSELERV